MALHHQDWETVIFHKKPSKQQNVPDLEPPHLRALKDNPESFVNKSFDSKFVQAVIKARLGNKWSQKDLAQKINVDVAIIQKLEQGKGIYDASLKNKLNRTLNLSKM
jgi:ribosome-binding protein aMBF1 (putative translation factor)